MVFFKLKNWSLYNRSFCHCQYCSLRKHVFNQSWAHATTVARQSDTVFWGPSFFACYFMACRVVACDVKTLSPAQFCVLNILYTSSCKCDRRESLSVMTVMTVSSRYVSSAALWPTGWHGGQWSAQSRTPPTAPPPSGRLSRRLYAPTPAERWWRFRRSCISPPSPPPPPLYARLQVGTGHGSRYACLLTQVKIVVHFNCQILQIPLFLLRI